MNRTQHYGPYASWIARFRDLRNDWATDTFDRHFTVRSNNDGTYTVVQQFKNGSFVTDAGPSPGSCDTTDGSPPARSMRGHGQHARLLHHLERLDADLAQTRTATP